MQLGVISDWVRGVFVAAVVMVGLCTEGVAREGQAKHASPAARPANAKSVAAAGRTPAQPPAAKPSVAPRAEPVRVSYGKRNGEAVALANAPHTVVEVVGVAPYPANASSRAQARIQARRAAILDAQRQLVEYLYGVSIASNSRLTERGLHDEVRVNAEGVVQGAQVVAERDWGDSYEVTLRWSPPEPTLQVPASPSTLPARVESHPTHPALPTHGYTGVIIDARGLGLQPSMSPRIRDAYGNTLWGNLNVAPEVAIEYGVAGWARTQHELSHPALVQRLGVNPLWLRASGVQGAGRNEVILAPHDAERLIQENARSGFLERLAVVFLY